MGPIHLYLGAWVAGGLLLGASLLLDGRDTPPAAKSEEPAQEPDALAALRAAEPARAPTAEVQADPTAGAALSPGARIFRLCSLALIGFGLCGLTAKGFDIDLWPWTLVSALTAGLLLFALGYRMSRATRSHF